MTVKILNNVFLTALKITQYFENFSFFAAPQDLPCHGHEACLHRTTWEKQELNQFHWWAFKCNYMPIIKKQMILTILASWITGSQWCVYELSKCSFAEIGLSSVHHHQRKSAKILLKCSSTVMAQSPHLTGMSIRIWPDEAVSSMFGTLWKVTGSRSI